MLPLNILIWKKQSNFQSFLISLTGNFLLRPTSAAVRHFLKCNGQEQSSLPITLTSTVFSSGRPPASLTQLFYFKFQNDITAAVGFATHSTFNSSLQPLDIFLQQCCLTTSFNICTLDCSVLQELFYMSLLNCTLQIVNSLQVSQLNLKFYVTSKHYSYLPKMIQGLQKFSPHHDHQQVPCLLT